MSNGYGLVSWGTGSWGVPYSSAPPINPYVQVINVTPPPGSFNIARNQTFTFTIKTKFALNFNAVYVTLDNKTVINGTTFNTTDFTISVATNQDNVSKDYTITPNYLFVDGSVFTLQVYATDIYGNPSRPFWAGYIVADTRPSLITPIYPLDGYTNVPLDLTIHFLINQLAAPNSGLDASTLNININTDPAVIAGIIQSAYSGEFSVINTPNNITDPIEVILDYTGRYAPNEIVTVNVVINEIGEVPVLGDDGYIFDQSGHLAGQNIVVSSITKLANAEYNLVLADPLTHYLLDGVIVRDGYTFQDNEGNQFKIAVVGVQAIVITSTAPRRTGKYSFITAQNYENLLQPVFAGYFQGIYLLDNVGDGYHVNITWHPAKTARPDDDLYYLIYYSTTRSDVFFEGAKLITQGRKLPPPETIKGRDAQLYGYFARLPLPIGVSYYVGVRATEFPHSLVPLFPADGYGKGSDGLIAVDNYSFKIPEHQVLQSNLVGSGAIEVTVFTTKGYANYGGYIVVGGEVMKYDSLTPKMFMVSAGGRGQFGTSIQPTHNVGEVVKLYLGNHDDNTIIDTNVILWEPPFDPHRQRADLVTTDFTLEDAYNIGFEPFDYCGYHSPYPDLLFQAKQCNTYLGGTYDGSVGFMLQERQLAVEEQLLTVTGEGVVLLRRLWQGEACICRTSRKDIAMVRSCAVCFGTGFKGGFVQYSDPRYDNGRVLVHFAPYDEDLGMGAQSGWEQKFKPNSWTLNVPSIKDRDILVRFDQENPNEVTWFYIVNQVSRGETVFGNATRQRMNVSRIDKTDVIYGYKLMI